MNKIPIFYPSRIPDQGVKKHRIPDPDPQHCFVKNKNVYSIFSSLLVYSTGHAAYYFEFVTSASFSAQASISNIEFDFLNYGIQRFREYRRRKAILEF
jgi:hypothetical protein